MATLNPPRTAQGYVSEYLGWTAALTEALETVPDLMYPMSIQTYGKMRNDPQLTAVLNAYVLPLMQAPKHLDPAGCRPEVVALVADDLGLSILGTKTVPGPARRRGVDFDDHFRVALLNLVFGHMAFAQRYEIINGQARLAELAERMPSTITDILLDDSGRMTGILQYGATSPIPINNLVWYAHNREGAAYQGRSMLRSAYGAWLIKHEMWRVLATSSRRFGMGVPNVEAPVGATGEQIEQATLLASAARVGDQSGAGLPNGFKFNLTGITGSVPDTLAFIRYLDSQMAQMALASVLNLDASPNGSRALGDTFVNLMLTSLNAIGREMQTVLTKLVTQMVDYNFGEKENVPRVVIGDAGSRPEVTAEAINSLLASGALTPDPELEGWVRERFTLPEKPEMPDPVPVPLPTGQPAPMPTGVPGSTIGPEPTPVAAGRQRRARLATAAVPDRRALTTMEAASNVNPESIDQTWTDTVTALLKDWSKISRAQRIEITDQIAAAVDDDSIDGLAALAVDSTDAADMLATAMVNMARDAASEMKGEARKQGVSVSGEEIDETRLTSVAAAVATIIAAGLAGAAGREALRVWAPGQSGSDVADQVDEHMKSLSDSYLKDQLGSAVSAAQNHGRQAVLNAAPPAKYFASEVLDTNTCKNCREIDGEQFADMAAAEQAYVSGGYTECLGRLRCRGIVVAVWDD